VCFKGKMGPFAFRFDLLKSRFRSEKYGNSCYKVILGFVLLFGLSDD